MLEKLPNSIKIKLVSIPLMIVLLTGCGSFELDKNKSEMISKAKSCYFELDNYDDDHFVNVSIEDGMDYSYLNDMVSLTDLVINDMSKEPMLNNIDGNSFKNKMNIAIGLSYSVGSFNEERYGFLKDIPYIDNLYLGNDNNKLNIDYEYLSSLKNVHNLRISVGLVTNYKDVDLSHLDTLTIEGKPYDVALNFSNESIKKLEDSGVKVIIEDREKVESINNEIKDIYNSFNFKETDSKQFKLNKIIAYVLDRLTYDEGIAKKQVLGKKISDEDLADEFYKDGKLDGVFNNETQICGNYSSLLSILCREAGIDNYNLVSKDHSWNAVKIDNGDYYVVDTTLLDKDIDLKVTDDDEKINNVLESGFGYLEDINAMHKYDEKLYNESGIPEGLDTNPAPRISIIKDYQDDEKYALKITCNGDRYYLPFRYSAYFLMGFGLVAAIETNVINKKHDKSNKKSL